MKHHYLSITSCVSGLVLCAGALYCAMADDPLITSAGVGARALALGNSFVARANDFTAVYWNPAGLAFVPVREASVSLEALRDASESDFSGTTTGAQSQQVSVGHAGLLRSVPTSQGGFAFAIGYTCPDRFDNVYGFRGVDSLVGPDRLGYYSDVVGGEAVYDTLHTGEKLDYNQAGTHAYGQLGMINFAAGWQIAPSLGVGLTISPIVGSESQTITTETIRVSDSLLFQSSTETFTRSYGGIDVRAGMLYAPAGIFRYGLRLVLPEWIHMTDQYAFTDTYYGQLFSERDDAVITTSFSGAFGVSAQLPYVTVSAEGNFRSPFAGMPETDDRAHWKGGACAGAEASVPHVPVLLRAGYQWQQPDWSPYKLQWNTAQLTSTTTSFEDQSNYQMISGGLAVVIKDYFAIEAAYAYSFWKYSVVSSDWANAIVERHSLQRGILSFSLRY